MTRSRLHRLADTRPGYATYADTAPGDPGHRWHRTTPAPTTTPRPLMPIGGPYDLLGRYAIGAPAAEPTVSPPSAPQEPAQAPPTPTDTPDTAERISAVHSGPPAPHWWQRITAAGRAR